MLLLKYQWQEITEKFAMRRHNLYHEDSNWWEEESKDESTDSVAIALSHPGSAAKSFSEICRAHKSALKSQPRLRDATDSYKIRRQTH